MNVSAADYEPYPVIKISALTGKEYIDAIMEQSDSESDSDNHSEEEEEVEGDQKCRRLKERKIKHVIEKVLKWRELYAGIDSKDKIPLEEGAKIVNISKKTLDDYLSQIKKGKKYGFNFNEHKNDKIGVLREFIRKV